MVDDDESIRHVVRAALEYDGYRVVTAGDGAAGLAALMHVDASLVLLDMRMPNVDGREFSRRYRAENESPAPIVLMTAADDAAAWCAEIGAAGCLPKPFDLDDLYVMVQQRLLLAGQQPNHRGLAAARTTAPAPAIRNA